MRNLCLKASTTVVADYFHLFVNRRAYTLQSNRPHPESSRHYYYRSKDKKTGQGLSLTADTIRRYLEGEITIGLYAINPATQCSKWVAIDADYEDALADLIKLRFQLRQDGVESALEKSHRGGHLWIFLAEPLPAHDCRIYIYDLALRLGIPVKRGRQEGVEIFPKHDALKPGRYGNAIRGPLGIHRGAGQRYWFDTANEDLESQMRYLNSLPKMTGDQLARLIAGKAVPPQLLPPEPQAESVIWRPSITLLGSWPESLKMRFRTTWTTPAFGQTQIALTQPVPLTFMDLIPPELNKVILEAGQNSASWTTSVPSSAPWGTTM